MPSGWSDIELPGLTGSGAGNFLADITLPIYTLDVSGGSSSGPASVSLPMLTVAAHGNSKGAVTIPGLTVEATGLVGAVSEADIELPALTAGGRSGAVASVELPILTFDGTGVVGSTATADVDLPSLTVDADGTVRIVGTGSVTLKGLTGAGTGYAGEVATVDISIPILTVSASGGILPVGTADVTLPALTVYGVGTVTEVISAMALELAIFAFSKYSNYEFNSMCKFGDIYLGCTGSAIYSLENDDDAGNDISAYFEPGITDFDLVNQKRLRKLYLGGESKGSLKATTKDAEGNAREYTIDPWQEGQQQVGAKTAIGRDGKSRYWGLKVENVDGCNFAIDNIDAMITVLAKRPKGEYNFGRMLFPMVTVAGTGS